MEVRIQTDEPTLKKSVLSITMEKSSSKWVCKQYRTPIGWLQMNQISLNILLIPRLMHLANFDVRTFNLIGQQAALVGAIET